MSRDEVIAELQTGALGTLSPDNPRIESPNGDFSLELRQPKRKSRDNATTWICYEHVVVGCRPQFDLYDEPLRVALGRNGRVLLFETQCLLFTRDVLTTQMLNRYLRVKTARS
jgi:hypothetical protein